MEGTNHNRAAEIQRWRGMVYKVLHVSGVGRHILPVLRLSRKKKRKTWQDQGTKGDTENWVTTTPKGIILLQ